MNWTFEAHKHYTTEHLNRAEKQRLVEDAHEDNSSDTVMSRGKRARRKAQR